MTSAACSWRIVGQSVRGAAHRRRQQPNQDAVAWWPRDGASATAIVAVADGHGSERSPRSADGARLAADAAVEMLRQLLEGPEALDAAVLRRLGEDVLPGRLLRRWRQAVRQHLAEFVLEPSDADPASMEGPFLAYGTTLLAAAVTTDTLLVLQIGDGDVLTVSADGSVIRPLPPDPRLLANATTSLCSADLDDCRLIVQPLTEEVPALILLSTDGYANSFPDDAGFLQVGSDLLAMIRQAGLAAVSAQLQSWLDETSSQGSGDDVTLGLLCRGDLLGETIDERPGVSEAV